MQTEICVSLSVYNNQITPKDTKKVFVVDATTFESAALQVFEHQYRHCTPYRQYIHLLGINPSDIRTLENIPFMPIEFFRQFDIRSNTLPPQICFESSTTGGTVPSKHYVTDLSLYEASFTQSFSIFFGDAADYCHLALLPGYLERSTSSLVFQVNGLMKKSRYANNGFYLYNHNDLYTQLKENESAGIPSVLWGVSFALWDFAEQYPTALQHTTIIETGGMKGRRREITRQELHNIIRAAFGVSAVASEYGMTELLSQAYATAEGLFSCPPWMKVLPRDINDPLSAKASGQNCGLNIIDLANYNSCSFIATSDIGRVYDNGHFEVLGRFDHSDTRGCNLMAP